jgi:GNAT superfamily N-acetyltransferase
VTTISGPSLLFTVAPARSRRDWTDVGRLIHEYMRWVIPAIGWRSPDEVAERIAPELGDPGGYYTGRGSAVFVARHDREAVGMGGLHFHVELAEVVRMYVRPAARHNGVGSALLDVLIAEAVRCGIPRLYLETDPVTMADAVRLYRAYGFVAFGTHPHGPAEFLDMEMVLVATDGRVNGTRA